MNQDIERIALFLKEHKDFYFTISYGKEMSLTDKLFVPLTDDSNGDIKFIKQIEKLATYKPDYVVIKLYKKAQKYFKKKPESVEKIVLKKQTEFNGFGSLESAFGGLNGFIETKVSLSTLKSEKDFLTRELEKTRQELKELKDSQKTTSKENIELQDKIRELKREKQDLTWDNKREIENIRDKNKQLDRFITLGGTILANSAGIDEETIKGFLGIDDEKQLPETNEEKKETKVTFKAESEQKTQARNIAEQIKTAIDKTIDVNTDENAFNLMVKIGKVFNYITESVDNLTLIANMISPSPNNNTADTNADDGEIEEIETINN